MSLFPMYLVILLVFVNRYVLGLFLRLVRRRPAGCRAPAWEPTVTVVTPMFNEGRRIARTIDTVMALDYPASKLQMIVVDDCSSDDSHGLAQEAARPHAGVRVLRNPENRGKRRSIIAAVRAATSEVIVSIDSDVEVEPGALRHLLAGFGSPEVAAVGGRVHVSNVDESWLTRIQTIKYFFGYQFLKNLEHALQSVMCLSGCLTAYRRTVLLELEPVLEARALLGVPIKYGEDRFLTRQIVKAGYRTALTLDAACATAAPATLSAYFSQQLRWRRSNLVDLLGGVTHAWRLHPLVAVHYLSMGALLVSYPLVVALEVAGGAFFELALFHLGVLAAGAVVYRLASRGLPASRRVHPAWFLGMAVLMPVTYVLLTPLALFTLDSGSWETRGAPRRAAPPELAPALVGSAEPAAS